MTQQIIQNQDGTFTIIDTDITIKMWNGTAIVQIPKQIFKGTLAQAQAQLAMANNLATSATARQTIAQAIVDSISSVPAQDSTPVDNPTM
jgi:hypothetical protein